MASTNVLILAGGDETRWTASGGTGSKMLVEVAGEQLLPRTVRMLRERRVEPEIIAWHPDIKALFPGAFMPGRRRWIVESVLDLRPHWGDALTVLFLGDVMYSEELLRQALHSRRYFNVFGNDEEIFAISIPGSLAARWAEALKAAIVYAETRATDKAVGKLWTAYRAYIGADLDKHEGGTGKVFHQIAADDPTCDFDYLREYKAYLERLHE